MSSSVSLYDARAVRSRVITSRTCGRRERPTPNNVAAKDPREGIDQVLQEVRASVVRPVGGRIITLRSTCELAFVGFGGKDDPVVPRPGSYVCPGPSGKVRNDVDQ